MQCLSWEGKYRRAQREKTKLRKFDYSYIKYDVMEYSDGRKTVHTVLEMWSVEALKLNRHVTTINCE